MGGEWLGVPMPVALGLAAVAFAAGFVDAIAGGGGLLQVPALLAAFPSPGDVAVALGVNKVSSLCGTTAAVTRYAAKGHVRWDRVAVYGPVAFVASFAGTWGLVEAAKEAAHAIRPAFAALFVALAVHQIVRALRTRTEAASDVGPARPLVALAFVGLIGLYDGLVGPGTGMFLFWAFTTWLALSPLDATGTTKAINGITNVGALAAFLARGTAIVWPLALTMAAANTAGGLLGARTAIRRGARLIRFVTAVASIGASVFLLLL